MDPHQNQSALPPEPQASAPEPSLSALKRWAEWLRRRINLRLLMVTVVLGLIAALWIDTRTRIHDLQQELARKLMEGDGYNKESRQIASQARETARDLEYRLGMIEGRVAETQNQRLALEALYLEFTRNRDERVLAEVEQILLIASQQLQLAGNVKAALIALESADGRLQRADSAQFTGLRRAIRRDTERLKSTPYVDLVGMSLRLDSLDHEVDSFPLAMYERPTEEKPVAVRPDEGTLVRLAREAWQDIHTLVRIQRIDRDEVPLVSPSQAFFLRENLRLRLMSARVALLAHGEDSFKADTRGAIDWLQRYFDVKDRKVGQALATLKQLAAAEVTIDVPDISGSLEAVRDAKLVRERGLR